MHSSYSHFSWFCYPDSFKLHPTIQYTHQLRVPAKKHFNYYFTIIKSFRKLSYSVSRTPIFKLTGSNLTKENCKFIQSATAPRFYISVQHWGQLLTQRTKNLSAFPRRFHKVGSHPYTNGYHDRYQMSIRTTQQTSVSFPVFKESSELHSLIYPHAILF